MSVFKRQSGSHMHVRTPIMIGIILLLVVVLSAFCYYRVNAPLSPADAVSPPAVGMRR